MAFKDKLKKLRVDKGLSQYALADILNISRSVVAKWETGLALPSEDSIRLLTEYFQVTKEYLLDNEEVEKTIVGQNRSISNLKKLSICLACIIIIFIVILLLEQPEKLSNQINKLGNYEAIEISLYDYGCEKTYYLDKEKDKNAYNIAILLLEDLEYRRYKSTDAIPEWIGRYTIILTGDNGKVIKINGAFIEINGEVINVKEWIPYNTLNQVIYLLIKSDSIDILDEDFLYPY